MTIDLADLFSDVEGMDEKSIYALFKALKNNFDSNAFDYFRFKKSLKSLEQLKIDQDTSYKSAFATAATMGLTKEKLVNSAKKYLRVLDQERESFAKALIERKKVKVDGRKAEVADFHKKIEQHKVKIQELQREIEIYQRSIDNVDQDVEQATLKIEGTKDRFLNVYNVLAQAITADIETINKNL